MEIACCHYDRTSSVVRTFGCRAEGCMFDLRTEQLLRVLKQVRNEGTPSVLQMVYNKPRQHWRSCSFQYSRHLSSVLEYFLAKYTDTQIKCVWCFCCCCFFLHASTLKKGLSKIESKRPLPPSKSYKMVVAF